MKLIAEIGWNHMGDMHLAEEMIVSAAKSGATHAKFQTWSVDLLKDGPWNEDGRRSIYEKAELTEEKHSILKDICLRNNIKFLTSCFSHKHVPFIASISDEIKVPSTEIANEALMQNIVKNFKHNNQHHVYVSTGASTSKEVENIVEFLRHNDMNFTILHCVSCYPTTAETCNLSRISYLKSLHQNVGYSGHYMGIEDAIVAVELGASVVEKHFTIDRELPGRDNKFALLPEDLMQFSDYLSKREKMLKPHGKEFLSNESEMRQVYRGRWDKS